MRPLLVQTKLFSPLAVYRFHDLAFVCVPASPLSWPSMLAVVAWRSKHHRSICFGPLLVTLTSLKACVGQIHTCGWLTHHCGAWIGKGSCSQKVLSVWLFLGAGWCNGIAAQHTTRVNCGQDMKAIVPSQTIREASGSDAVEPAWATTFVVADCHTHTIKEFIGLVSDVQGLNKRLTDRNDRIVGSTDGTIELRAIG